MNELVSHLLVQTKFDPSSIQNHDIIKLPFSINAKFFFMKNVLSPNSFCDIMHVIKSCDLDIWVKEKIKSKSFKYN